MKFGNLKGLFVTSSVMDTKCLKRSFSCATALEYPNLAIVGCARVSTCDQDYSLQVEQLERAGCDKIFHEKKSGLDGARPELKCCLEYVREGDVLLVSTLDRLARSTSDLHNIETRLRREWQMEGIARARAKGRVGGRPKQISDAIERQILALKSDGLSVRKIAREVGFAWSTVQKVISDARQAAN